MLFPEAWHSSGDTEFTDLSIISKPRPVARPCRAPLTHQEISLSSNQSSRILQTFLEYTTESRYFSFSSTAARLSLKPGIYCDAFPSISNKRRLFAIPLHSHHVA
jgi:hypothetical protein